MRGNELRISTKGRIFAAIILVIFSLTVLGAPVFAWFSFNRIIGAYAPISKPEALYIGAGHRNIENNVFTDDYFEDIRYLYLDGIDVTSGRTYYDYVFSVFGKAISGYKLQLAYTTNNQFNYAIYPATEYTEAQYNAMSAADKEGAVGHTTHSDDPETYYYKPSGNTALTGAFLNDQTVAGELLADTSYHSATYAAYNNVDKYAEPLYWQTTNAERGNPRGDFIHYYILRVYVNGKSDNDRETDVICIAAKSFSIAS